MVKLRLVAAAVLLLVALWGWFMLSPTLNVPLRLWPGGPIASVPVLVLPLLGMAGGWAAMAWFRFIRPATSLSPDGAQPDTPETDTQPFWAIALLAVGLVALAVLVLVAVEKRMLEAAPGALLLICGTVALIAGTQAIAAIRGGDTVGLSSHWGGLGGGHGGWKISPATTLLLVALIFLGTAVAVSGVIRGDGNQSATNRTETGKDTNKIVTPPQQPGGPVSRTGS